jgi:ATP-dependent Zn protease
MYKVGDRVMVVEREFIENTFNKIDNPFCPYIHPNTGMGFNMNMMNVCGTYVTIKHIVGNYYLVEEIEGRWIEEFFVKESLAPTKLQEYRYTRKNIVDNLGKEIERITKLVDESEEIQLQMLEKIKELDDLIEDILIEKI